MSLRKLLPRVEIRKSDDRICNYPTTARTGDKTRLGNRTIFFDDTDTVIYNTDQLISWPTTLPQVSKYLASTLTSSIFYTGSITKNNEQWIETNRQFETPGPFKESNLFEQDIKTSVFYNTGSALEKFGNDFLNNLGSKTKISFEIPMNTATQLQAASASIYYMNSQLGKFEEIAAEQRQAPRPSLSFNEARLFGPLGNNVLSSSQNILFDGRATIGSAAELAQQNISYLSDTINTVTSKLVTNNLGRLLQTSLSQSALTNSSFAATSSQYISLEDYITQPFLIEKVILEIPIKAGAGWLEDYTRLCRRISVNGYQNNPHDFGGPAITLSLINQINDTNRELILSSTIIPQGDNFASASSDKNSAVWQERFATGFLSYGSPSAVILSGANTTFTGTVRIATEPNIANGVFSISYQGNYIDGFGHTTSNYGDTLANSFAISVNPFGRGMTGNQSGRSIFGKEYAVPSYKQTSALAKNFPYTGIPVSIGNPDYVDDVFVYSYEQNEISPYIVYPTDKLIFAISKYRACISRSVNYGIDAAYDFNEPMPLNRYHDVWIDTGSVKINLYGSLVKENKEFHDTLNSKLDTNAVHEMISNPILDEWDVCSIQELSGNYTTDYISGSIFKNNLAGRGLWLSSVNNSNTRFLSADRVADQVKFVYEIVASKKNVETNSNAEQFYDSMAPTINDLIDKGRAEARLYAWYLLGAGTREVVVLNLDTNDLNKYSGHASNDWSRAFPFEPMYATAKRATTYKFFAKNILGTSPAEVFRAWGKYYSLEDNFIVKVGTSPFTMQVGLDQVNPGTEQTGLRNTEMLKLVYGIGDFNNCYNYSSVTYGACDRPRMIANVVTNSYAGAEIRGWKYGLINGIPQYSKIIWRRDKYGQYRDMLEQRLNTKFFMTTEKVSVLTIAGKSRVQTTDSPVNVKFVNMSGTAVRPEETYSSNLSFEATSSLPYFDGYVRNREEPLNTLNIQKYEYLS